MLQNVAADSALMGIEAHGDLKLTKVLIAEVTYDMVRGELKASGDPLPRQTDGIQIIVARTH